MREALVGKGGGKNRSPRVVKVRLDPQSEDKRTQMYPDLPLGWLISKRYAGFTNSRDSWRGPLSQKFQAGPPE